MQNNILDSKLFRAIILSIAGLIVLVIVFGLGVFVGTKKADFSFKWAEQYHRNFGGPMEGFLGNMMGNEFTSDNGVFGQIIKIDGQTLTIKDRDNIEKIVTVDNKTTINFLRDNKKISDLKIGDNVVVIGEPTANGQIKAELLRIIPPMPGVAPTELPKNLGGPIPTN